MVAQACRDSHSYTWLSVGGSLGRGFITLVSIIIEYRKAIFLCAWQIYVNLPKQAA